MSRKVISRDQELLTTLMALLTADNGVKFTDLGRGYIEGAWRMLSNADRQFLLNMKRGDFSNIVIGENRQDEKGDTTYFYEGKWQRLPIGVDKFLSNVFEDMVERGEGYTE